MINNRKHHWANLCTKANCHETKANCHHPIWLDCNCQSHLPPAIVKNAGVLDVLWGCALFLISFFSEVFWVPGCGCRSDDVVECWLNIKPEFSGRLPYRNLQERPIVGEQPPKASYAATGWTFYHLSFVNSTLSNRYNYVVSNELLPLYASVQD